MSIFIQNQQVIEKEGKGKFYLKRGAKFTLEFFNTQVENELRFYEEINTTNPNDLLNIELLKQQQLVFNYVEENWERLTRGEFNFVIVNEKFLDFHLLDEDLNLFIEFILGNENQFFITNSEKVNKDTKDAKPRRSGKKIDDFI